MKGNYRKPDELAEINKRLLELSAKLDNQTPTKKSFKGMSIPEFAKAITSLEHGAVQVNIAQLAEILKIIDDLLQGEFYKLIKQE